MGTERDEVTPPAATEAPQEAAGGPAKPAEGEGATRGFPKKVGRKGRDWPALFNEWLASGLPKNDFLRTKGINPGSGSAFVATKDWKPAPDAVADKMLHAKVASDPRVERIVPNVVPINRAEVLRDVEGRDPSGVNPQAQPPSWQIINQWRQKQAVEDWKSSDTIRTHVKLLLRHSLVKVTKEGPDGQPVDEFQSSMKPNDLRAIAQTLSDVQRIQRLALGLSTENVGIEGPQNHIERGGAPAAPQPATPAEEPIPTFVVEMSRNGKFMRARPRRVK